MKLVNKPGSHERRANRIFFPRPFPVILHFFRDMCATYPALFDGQKVKPPRLLTLSTLLDDSKQKLKKKTAMIIL